MSDVVLQSDIPGLRRHSSGKVRDVYDLGALLLIVTTDRVSAFDRVMPTGIPDKGRILTQISRHWFLHVSAFQPNHYVSAQPDFVESVLTDAGVALTPEMRSMLAGRAMVALKADVYPVECVVRGYLAGSLWSQYMAAGGARLPVTLHGIDLPAGLRHSDRLPEPIFTPATKAATGHDENIGMTEMRERIGSRAAETLRAASLRIYAYAADRALEAGIIIADTKFEFGMRDGVVMLVDEVLTPDSSRFWDAASYEAGKPQASFDKQFLRDWLVAAGWNREPPAPKLPDDVVEQTAARYREAYRRITGKELPPA
ncbi:MAG TPA: phosphoribosylaminoimidazolesuccinocarboxamide synthase [Chthonomonadales bacterium]|nr:phosphoribosylaminoimidazolesuccinocarboxamide synthase [Chthonomonadales bacterium]